MLPPTTSRPSDTDLAVATLASGLRALNCLAGRRSPNPSSDPLATLSSLRSSPAITELILEELLNRSTSDALAQQLLTLLPPELCTPSFQQRLSFFRQFNRFPSASELGHPEHMATQRSAAVALAAECQRQDTLRGALRAADEGHPDRFIHLAPTFTDAERRVFLLELGLRESSSTVTLLKDVTRAYGDRTLRNEFLQHVGYRIASGAVSSSLDRYLPFLLVDGSCHVGAQIAIAIALHPNTSKSLRLQTVAAIQDLAPQSPVILNALNQIPLCELSYPRRFLAQALKINPYGSPPVTLVRLSLWIGRQLGPANDRHVFIEDEMKLAAIALAAHVQPEQAPTVEQFRKDLAARINAQTFTLLCDQQYAPLPTQSESHAPDANSSAAAK